jgi:hypothetical protein
MSNFTCDVIANANNRCKKDHDQFCKDFCTEQGITDTKQCSGLCSMICTVAKLSDPMCHQATTYINDFQTTKNELNKSKKMIYIFGGISILIIIILFIIVMFLIIKKRK